MPLDWHVPHDRVATKAPEFVNQWVRWGCGPRAGQGLLLAAKSHAGLSGRTEVTFADVRKFVHPVMAASHGFELRSCQ